MTFYYADTTSWTSAPQPSEKTVKFWEHIVNKVNWRIVQLPNGYYQTEYKDLQNNWVDVTRRETVDGAEAAIDSSIDHYTKKLEFVNGPVVVKTFE